MDYTKEISDAYNTKREQFNVVSDARFWEVFHKQVPTVTGKRVLDLGSGMGVNLRKVYDQGAESFGIDVSDAMIATAREDNPGIEFMKQDISGPLPFPDNHFDVVISNWTIQILSKFDRCFAEVFRVLKPGGSFVFLTKSPLIQWELLGIEGKDYFKQVTVTSRIFGDTITVTEPSHTYAEYFQELLVAGLRIDDVQEGYEFPTSQQLHGNIHPTFLIISAQKA